VLDVQRVDVAPVVKQLCECRQGTTADVDAVRDEVELEQLGNRGCLGGLLAGWFLLVLCGRSFRLLS
jgi:hypothetical protein